MNRYIDHREEILAEFADRSEAKNLFIAAMYKSDRLDAAKTDAHPVLEAFDRELKEIQQVACHIPEYKVFRDAVPSTERNNWNGKTMNRIVTDIEAKITLTAKEFFESECREVCTIMHDVLLIYGDFYGDDQLLKKLQETTNQKFENLSMEWAYKPPRHINSHAG